MSSPHDPAVRLHEFQSEFSLRHKLVRQLWQIVWLLLFRPSPRIAFGWRRWLLRLFGARVGQGVRVYSSVKVFYPAHLELGEAAILGPDVDCYCVALIRIGPHAMVSQYSYLCAASHDYTQPHLPLVTAPIVVAGSAWVCADCFVGPGVTVGEGAVVGARSTVFRDVPPWMVVAGNPPRVIRRRELQAPAESAVHVRRES